MSGCNGEDEPLVLAIADDGSSITLVKRCDDDDDVDRDVVDTGVVVSGDDFARTRQDADAPSNHENGAARVFPLAMDVNSTRHETTKDQMMEGMRDNIDCHLMEDRKEANVDQYDSPRVSKVSSHLYSSAAAVDSSSHHGKESCSCDNYKNKRDMFREELQKAMKFQNLWTELRQHIRAAFNIILELAHAADFPHSQYGTLSTTEMHVIADDTVIQLCKRDPHQLFMRLVSQVQEFVVEVKVRLFALLNDVSVNNLAEILLTGLLDDYEALISIANFISELVNPLKEYLFKFNLTWECFIKKLYQIYVYNDAFVQNNLPTFINQLRKLLPLKGSEYQDLVHRYLSFDDEMTRIGNLWPETEPWMDKYNAEQAIRVKRLKQVREAWELFTETHKLVEQSILNKTSDIRNEMQEIHGQFSSLIAHTSGSDSQPSSPMIDFSSESMPSTIEIVEMLLDDWNQAQHQKLADIAGALTATEVDVIGQEDTNCYNYARATCQLAQNAISSVRNNSDDSSDMENSDKGCKCHTCNETEVDRTDTQCKVENAERNDIRSFPSISNGFSEEPTNCTPTKLKKKLEVLIDIDKKKKDTGARDTLHKNINSKASEQEPCLCVYQHAREIAERKREILEKPPCPCLLNSNSHKWETCPCLTKAVTGTVVTNGRPKTISPISVIKANSEPNQKSTVKTGSMQSAQPQTRHSTTQTPSTTHNHNTQGNTHSHAHGPLLDIAKNTVPSHPKLHQLNHTPHACHKQANVEHIKRVSCNDLSSGDGECSDSISSRGESCSSSSSAQRDTNARHCDCCYCEVFGHGMASVTPVSRTYKETRERLRQLLTKKKAKKCKAGCSPPKSPSESLTPKTNSEFKPVTIVRTNTPTLLSSVHDQQDQRNLEELLEFIEGNQSGKKENNKKAEKKARQKQRKIEEKLKKDRQEAERQKLIELQKKTPEVTITVVDPQKPVPQRLLPQCNLPEVSILPTSLSVSLPAIKQLNNRKKDKQEVFSNSHSNSHSITNLNNKAKAVSANLNVKNKSINSAEKFEVRSTNSNQGYKSNTKNDKIESNKGSKPSASINTSSTKNSSNNNTDKLSDIDLLDKKLTKKERKKLKKEMKKLEEAKAKENENTAQTESQPQIVTIRREINSNSAEPTVTITLKGQTPAEDKVLFTLVNGQTKEPSHKQDQEQNQSNSGKKKKGKANNNNNPLPQGNKSQQSNNSKQQTSQVSSKASGDGKNSKHANNEKSKTGKQVDEKKVQQQSVNETKNSKSKKDKRNTENKENVLQQQNTMNKNKNQQNTTNNKKQNKTSTPPQTPVSQKQQQNQNIANESTTSKKAKKQQQNQQHQQDKNVQSNVNKSNKNINISNINKNVSNKNEPQKNVNKTNQVAMSKQHAPTEIQNTCAERVSSPSLSSQFKDIGPNSKINIENLKLPPGITITKVDAPPKPIPIKTAPLPKPVNPPKQTTIIAAPMSGVQSSYANPQAGGNVIVVDTGKLKQDLLPKPNEKDSSKNQPQSTTSSKKKKKKNKNSANSSNIASTLPAQNSDTFTSDHTMDEPARILHNPGTNMVTIRNPSFGPMKVPPTQQAAIIKVSDNGMVTIRSPALQQAINAGLTSPSKPDYVVKGDLLSSSAGKTTTATSDCGTLNVKHANGVISSSLAELRSRLTGQSDCASSLSGLANIQISKVTNGQPIPENGINLKGTSVTLTKVRPETTSMEDPRQAKSAAAKEAISVASITAANGSNSGGNGKSKKKKKRGSGSKQSGDDWNLVESVFRPKDIEDLENGEMDEGDREVEAFKRFCLQSVPLPKKEKVHLNIKDIVFKKKSTSPSSSSSSSSSSATTAAATVIAAN